MTLEQAREKHAEAVKKYHWAIIHGTVEDIVKASDNQHAIFMILSQAAINNIGALSKAVIKYAETV